MLFVRLHEPLSAYIGYTLFTFGIGAALIITCIPTFNTTSLVFGVPTAFGLVGICESLTKVFDRENQRTERGIRLITVNAIQSVSLRASGLCAVLVIIVLISPFRGTSSTAEAVGVVERTHRVKVED